MKDVPGRIRDRRCAYVEPRDTLTRVSTGSVSRPQILAIYRPHFYPDPTVEAVMGPGWCEWRRVTGARPLFRGHGQPRYPKDLGFADPRVPEVRATQAALARAFGIDGFAYMHYWFAGRRLYERPFAEVLDSGEPDFPFCLLWCNEDLPALGLEVAMSAQEQRSHAEFLARAFVDPRYLRIRGRPIFLVRRPSFVQTSGNLAAIRSVAEERGCGNPFMVAILGDGESMEEKTISYDGILRWPYPRRIAARSPFLGKLASAALHLIRYSKWQPELRIEREENLEAPRSSKGHNPIELVFAGWDDTPIHGAAGTIFARKGPERFRRSLAEALERAYEAGEGGELILIESWNGWSEGAFLEPDLRHGRSYLAAVARARLSAAKRFEGRCR